MRVPEHTAWGGGIWGNQPPTEHDQALLPYVILEERNDGKAFEAHLALGTRSGVPGVSTLTPNEENFVWIPEIHSMENPSHKGHHLSADSAVESADIVRVNCLVRGESFDISMEAREALGDLARRHGVQYTYYPEEDLGKILGLGEAGHAEIHNPGRHTLVLISQEGKRRIVKVPSAHFVAGCLRAAVAHEQDWLQAQELH